MASVACLCVLAAVLSLNDIVQAKDLPRSVNSQPLFFSPLRGSSFAETGRFHQRNGGLEAGESRDPSVDEKPCCYPKVWQGIMYRYLTGQDTEYALTFYEDDNKQSLALDAVVTIGNSTTPIKFSQILQMDSTGTKGSVYQFDKVAKTCKRQDFTNVTYDQITGHCIPDDAFFAGAFPIGIPKGGASFTLRSWMWKPAPMELPDIHYERLVSTDCAPVLGITRGTLGGEPVLQSDYYFNIQTSITDPTVFNLPDYCKKPTLLSSSIPARYYNKLRAKMIFRKARMNADPNFFFFL